MFLGGRFASLSARNAQLSHAQYCSAWSVVGFIQSNNLFWLVDVMGMQIKLLLIDVVQRGVFFGGRFFSPHCTECTLESCAMQFCMTLCRNQPIKRLVVIVPLNYSQSRCTERTILHLSPVTISVNYCLDCQSVWSKLKVTYCQNDRSSLLLFVYSFSSQFHD